MEQIDAYDDLLNSILQARLAQVTVDQNNDMRKIASWAAIAARPDRIAGIYGMNFDHMPELHWRYGYPRRCWHDARWRGRPVPAVPPLRLAVTGWCRPAGVGRRALRPRALTGDG